MGNKPNLLPESINTYNEADAMELVKLLVANNYAVMVTKEDFDLWIISYIDTCDSNISDRNSVVFMSRDEFEQNFVGRVDGE